MPPGPIVGIISDFWQRSTIDVGLPGPDGGKGGKFLILPPGYKGDVPQSGYFVVRGTTNNYNLMVRGIIPSLDQKDAGVANIKRVKVYPLSESANPKPNKFTSFSGKKMNTLPPMGMAYWETLSAFINNNPVEDRDLFYMGMLKPLGIEKGKPFKPDARQRAILEEAARIGDAIGRVTLFYGDDRFQKGHPFPGAHWQWVFQSNAVQQTDTYGQVDERLHYTYGAIYTSPALGIMKPGPGGNYVQVFMDKDGNRLDGGKSYRLHVPAKAPAAAFWSITLYDAATRSQIQNASNDAARSSLDKLQTNADGSIDLYFGPTSPAGKEATGSRRFPARAGTRCSASTPRPRACLTGHGSCRTSSSSSREDRHETHIEHQADCAKGELGVEWRYLDYDLKSDGPITDLNFNGPAAGVVFRW